MPSEGRRRWAYAAVCKLSEQGKQAAKKPKAEKTTTENISVCVQSKFFLAGGRTSTNNQSSSDKQCIKSNASSRSRHESLSTDCVPVL